MLESTQNPLSQSPLPGPMELFFPILYLTISKCILLYLYDSLYFTVIDMDKSGESILIVDPPGSPHEPLCLPRLPGIIIPKAITWFVYSYPICHLCIYYRIPKFIGTITSHATLLLNFKRTPVSGHWAKEGPSASDPTLLHLLLRPRREQVLSEGFHHTLFQAEL